MIGTEHKDTEDHHDARETQRTSTLAPGFEPSGTTTSTTGPLGTWTRTREPGFVPAGTWKDTNVRPSSSMSSSVGRPAGGGGMPVMVPPPRDATEVGADLEVDAALPPSAIPVFFNPPPQMAGGAFGAGLFASPSPPLSTFLALCVFLARFASRRSCSSRSVM